MSSLLLFPNLNFYKLLSWHEKFMLLILCWAKKKELKAISVGRLHRHQKNRKRRLKRKAERRRGRVMSPYMTITSKKDSNPKSHLFFLKSKSELMSKFLFSFESFSILLIPLPTQSTDITTFGRPKTSQAI